MSKILLLTEGNLSNNFAGPGMRYFEFARALAKKHQVTLAGLSFDPDFSSPDVNVLKISAFNVINLGIKISVPNSFFRKELTKYDLIITPGGALRSFGSLTKIKTPIAIDLYNPWFFEMMSSGRSPNKKKITQNIKKVVEIIKEGNYFICASSKQRDLYIGLMLAAEKIDPEKLKIDPLLEDLIAVVPTGIPSTPPKANKKSLRSECPEIKESDKVVIWWGGMWDWLDPITLIKAIDIISRKRKDVKLVFFGADPLTAKDFSSKTVADSVELSKKLNLYQKQIYFISRWIPYAERANWLLDADIGIISHHKSLETEFSWRTRAMDYLWAGLPIITTEGDSIAALVEKHSLGRVVPYQNAKSMAEAILAILENPRDHERIKENIQRFSPSLYWENIVVPIHNFCKKLIRK